MEEINLLEVLQYFKSKLIWIILTVIAVVIVGNIYTAVTRVPMYSTSTTILLVSEHNIQEDEDDENTDSGSSIAGDLSLNSSLMNTYTELIKSRRILSQVIKNLKLKYNESQLAGNISLETKEGTSMFVLSVKDNDAKRARDITNELAKVFSNEVKEIYKLDNVNIIDEAIIPSSPYNLTYKKDNMLYLLIGVVLSCVIVFTLYYFDTTIKSTEVIEDKLGLTVLGVVPEERRGR